ncbi:CLUMA_CG006399, isoform A [Clunio marinus]|uniref:CLUMA_CG006399, isoform A n=1 Tax=Clunio marinus TaxID=568069 RepID=A0A1J1HXS3_9DIPT|nr:CLUMA_CG006399, isoform A [Clunio marinus]
MVGLTLMNIFSLFELVIFPNLHSRFYSQGKYYFKESSKTKQTTDFRESTIPQTDYKPDLVI